MRIRGRIPLALLLLSSIVGCQGTQRESISRLPEELRETFAGRDPDCRAPRNIDPALRSYLDDYMADAQSLGPDHYPLARLAQVRTLILVPLGATELQNDMMRMGLNRRVNCYDGERVYDIYIADPESTPERHRLRGQNMLRQVIYHELAHTYFDHYHDDPRAQSSKAGIMAAITDDRALSDDEMEQRKIELFSAESDYLKHLPPRD